MNLAELTKEQKQYMILGVLGVVIILGLGWFGIRLSLNSVEKAKTRLVELSDKIERADKTLTKGGNTSSDFESTTEYLKEELQRIPPDRNYYSWATEVIYSTGRNSGLEIDSVDEYTQSAGKAGAKAAVQFESYSLRISARGSYADTKDFLKVLEEDHPLVRIIGIDISSGGNPDSHDVQLLVQWPFKVDAVAKIWEQVGKTQTALAAKVSRPRLPIKPADADPKPEMEAVAEVEKTEAPAVVSTPNEKSAPVKLPAVEPQPPRPAAPKSQEPVKVVSAPKPEPVSVPEAEPVVPEVPAVAEAPVEKSHPAEAPEVPVVVAPEVEKEAVAEAPKPEPVIVPEVHRPEEPVAVAEKAEPEPLPAAVPEIIPAQPEEEPKVAAVEPKEETTPVNNTVDPAVEPVVATVPESGKSEPVEVAEEKAEIPEPVEEPEPVVEPVVVARAAPESVEGIREKEVEPEAVEKEPESVEEPEIVAVAVVESEAVVEPKPESEVAGSETFAALETLPAVEPEVVMTETEDLSVDSFNVEPQDPEAAKLQSLLTSLGSRGDESVEPEAPVEDDASVAELEALAAQLAAQQDAAVTAPVPADRPVEEPGVVKMEESEPEPVELKGEQYALTPNSAKILTDLLHVDKPKTADTLDSFLDGLMENIND